MMNNRTPPTRSDAAVEAWFAAAGITAQVVEQCSDARCRACAQRLRAA
jgi:hypothetical protein